VKKEGAEGASPDESARGSIEKKEAKTGGVNTGGAENAKDRHVEIIERTGREKPATSYGSTIKRGEQRARRVYSSKKE